MSNFKISDPSPPFTFINVPEVTDATAVFTYRYYTYDERVNDSKKIGNIDINSLPLKRLPRYTTITWKKPTVSAFGGRMGYESKPELKRIESNKQKILSENDSLNVGMLSHIFSDVESIEMGSSQLIDFAQLNQITPNENENSFSAILRHMSEKAANVSSSKKVKQKIAEYAEGFSTLADFPKKVTGLTVFDDTGKSLRDEGDFLRSIANDLSINVRINKKCIPDIFVNSKAKSPNENLEKFNAAYRNSPALISQINTTLNPVSVGNVQFLTTDTPPVLIIGYILEKYRSTNSGFVKEDTFFIESPMLTEFIDKSVLYGATYVYSITTVASYTVISKNTETKNAEVITIYVQSNPKSVPVECYEYKPPPMPINVSARFDYEKNKPIIVWDMPVNPQRDVTQFQVFRRKNTNKNFELIKQYGWDKSLTPDGETKYLTGEVVDCNNYEKMSDSIKQFAELTDFPIYFHRDDDFVIDLDFYEEVSYIYAIASIDAHGMISNYSEQIQVTYLPYKNSLSIVNVAAPGAPRQYPNMTLNIDTFKDVMTLDADDTELNIYLTPEYINLTGNDGEDINVFAAEISRKDFPSVTNNRYYYLQMINTDNQKMNAVKIKVYNPMSKAKDAKNSWELFEAAQSVTFTAADSYTKRTINRDY